MREGERGSEEGDRDGEVGLREREERGERLGKGWMGVDPTKFGRKSTPLHTHRANLRPRAQPRFKNCGCPSFLPVVQNTTVKGVEGEEWDRVSPIPFPSTGLHGGVS